MGGAQIAIIVSLLSFAVAMFGVARDALWYGSAPPEWIGWVAVVLLVVALLVAIAMIFAALGRAPLWIRRAVERLSAPADLRPLPDMPIRTLAPRLMPGNIGVMSTATAQNIAEAFLRELRQRAVLDSLTIWGRKNAMPGQNPPLLPIPADFWETGEIDWLSLFEVGSRAEGIVDSRQEWYIDLHLNEQQINKLYKTSKKTRMKLRRRLPWERVGA